MVYTAINVPYSALMGVITDDDDDRVSLSTFRFLGAFGGGFLVSLLVRPLVGAFGGGDEVVASRPRWPSSGSSPWSCSW